MRLRARRARLYESIRTAHLERARQLTPAAILYRERRYDFDPTLAEGLELVQAGPVQAALLLRRSRLDALEVNEPLMRSSILATALAIFAARALRRRRPRIVTYAIENADPFDTTRVGWKRRARFAVERRLAVYIWRRVDAVAFGTAGARDLYRALLPNRAGLRQILIPALPARPDDLPNAPRGETVVFLGAFVPRKGLPLLLEAWPLVVAELPTARLTLVGKGALEDAVRTAAGAEASIDAILDPPRAEIRRILQASRVLVLPSQPSPTWREQVGLPIVEGLEAGCSVVTTDETGIAPWLIEHGHAVVKGSATASQLARAILDQLARGDRAVAIAASLPLEDGRLRADRWMFDGV
ncbi:glycosyltransferase family 4 protein [Microbacterium sp.]|uniref:glycosyltransferase family 4 protein n=1 Tax=Microbacterium sp. TaxID=51671 RepID=UPI003F70B1A3